MTRNIIWREWERESEKANGKVLVHTYSVELSTGDCCNLLARA